MKIYERCKNIYDKGVEIDSFDMIAAAFVQSLGHAERIETDDTPIFYKTDFTVKGFELLILYGVMIGKFDAVLELVNTIDKDNKCFINFKQFKETINLINAYKDEPLDINQYILSNYDKKDKKKMNQIYNIILKWDKELADLLLDVSSRKYTLPYDKGGSGFLHEVYINAFACGEDQLELPTISDIGTIIQIADDADVLEFPLEELVVNIYKGEKEDAWAKWVQVKFTDTDQYERNKELDHIRTIGKFCSAKDFSEKREHLLQLISDAKDQDEKLKAINLFKQHMRRSLPQSLKYYIPVNEKSDIKISDIPDKALGKYVNKNLDK